MPFLWRLPGSKRKVLLFFVIKTARHKREIPLGSPHRINDVTLRREVGLISECRGYNYIISSETPLNLTGVDQASRRNMAVFRAKKRHESDTPCSQIMPRKAKAKSNNRRAYYRYLRTSSLFKLVSRPPPPERWHNCFQRFSSKNISHATFTFLNARCVLLVSCQISFFGFRTNQCGIDVFGVEPIGIVHGMSFSGHRHLKPSCISQWASTLFLYAFTYPSPLTSQRRIFRVVAGALHLSCSLPWKHHPSFSGWLPPPPQNSYKWSLNGLS